MKTNYLKLAYVEFSLQLVKSVKNLIYSLIQGYFG